MALLHGRGIPRVDWKLELDSRFQRIWWTGSCEPVPMPPILGQLKWVFKMGPMNSTTSGVNAAWSVAIRRDSKAFPFEMRDATRLISLQLVCYMCCSIGARPKRNHMTIRHPHHQMLTNYSTLQRESHATGECPVRHPRTTGTSTYSGRGVDPSTPSVKK